MNEAKMRQTVVKALRSLDAVSVENVCGAGTPDVNYTSGWIELKYGASWPKNPSAIVPIKLRPAQRAWLIRRVRAGGNCWALIRVKDDWVLLGAMSAAVHLGVDWTKADCLANSPGYWSGTPNWDQLKAIIT